MGQLIGTCSRCEAHEMMMACKEKLYKLSLITDNLREQIKHIENITSAYKELTK